MSRQRLAVLLLAAVAMTGPAAVAQGEPTSTVGPVVVAWWNAAKQHPALPSLTPPDVGARDLYVAGANAQPPGVGLPVDAGPTAIAGLRFSLPPGATVRSLQLRLAGTHPPAVSLTACRARQPFEAVYGGAWADVPTYDCRNPGTARLTTDGRVLIEGVDRLRDGRELAIVLVPGPLDRVVVAAPDASTLTLNAGSSVSGPAPLPLTAPPMSGSVSLPQGPGALTSAGGLPAPPTAPVQAPAAAPAPVAPRALTRAASTLPARPWQALCAVLLLALMAFASLVRPVPRGASAAAGVRGVGRLRSERTGSVPDLA